MNRISKARQARIDAGEEKLNYGSTIGQRTGERQKKPTIDELKKKGLVKRASTLTVRKGKKAGESQVDMFEEIWNARPHKCEVCSVPLREPRAWNFSHVLSKGAYPSMKYVRKNIMLKCLSCHTKWGETNYDPLDKNWARVLVLREELKEEAKKLGHK